MPAKTADLISVIRQTLARIEKEAEVLHDIQWDKGRRPAQANDAGTRQRGGKPDPTGETATDAPRLVVRDAVKATDRDLNEVARQLLTLETRILRARRKWEAE